MKPGGRILVVEDEEITRDVLRGILDGEGHAVVEAQDAGAARRLLAPAAEGRTHFDCIVLDRGLPDADGITVLREIRAAPALVDVPVVMATAYADAQAVTEGIAAGAHYYLTKPLQRELLLAVVEAAIAEHRLSEELRSKLQRVQHSMQCLVRGTFRLRLPEEAHDLALALAPLCPRPEDAALALLELLMNAIEHGNLGISYEEKKVLVLDGRLEEEVRRRLRDARLGARRVTVECARPGGGFAVTITDEGEGFDWRAFLDFSAERAFDPNGRGIALARASGVDELSYVGRGNVVTASWHPGSEHGVRLPEADPAQGPRQAPLPEA